MPLNGTKPATREERWGHDRPFLVWGVGVSGFFLASWALAPMLVYQLVLDKKLETAIALTAVGFVALVLGAYKLYLPELDPHDDSYRDDVASLQVWRELTCIALWPAVMFLEAARDQYRYKKACVISALQLSRQR